MSVFEIRGGPINHRYLMNKSKHDLARMYLELLDHMDRRVTGLLEANNVEVERRRVAERKIGDDSYWRDGTRLIESQRKEKIEQASESDWYSHAPIGMSPEQARGYLAGQIDAMQHSLEMMGHPEVLS